MLYMKYKLYNCEQPHETIKKICPNIDQCNDLYLGRGIDQDGFYYGRIDCDVCLKNKLSKGLKDFRVEFLTKRVYEHRMETIHAKA